MSYKIDMHCHSSASPDGGLSLLTIQSSALDYVAITDHDRIDFAIDAQQKIGKKIIVGEEITSSDGEIIGLYLQERVKPGLSALETVERIKAQKGLVYIPHPFETVRKGLQLGVLNQIAGQVDIIETINGRSFSRSAQAQARLWAIQHTVPGAASSDAHGRIGWGRVYSVIAEKPTCLKLPGLLAVANLEGRRNGLISYGYPTLNRFRNKRTQ